MEFTNKTNKSFFIFLFFLAIFALGISVYKDYGLNIDDEWYKETGEFYYQYIKILINNTNNYQISDIEFLSKEIIGFSIPYMNPVLFELPHIYISKILNLNESKQIYQLAHFLNFIIFFLSLIFFYRLINKKFNSKFYGIFAVLILFSSPRIFAESFYNSRDIFYLSLFIFFLTSSYNFLFEKGFKSSLLLVITSSFIIYAKIVGFLAVLIFFIFYFLNYKKKDNFIFKEFKTFFIIIISIFLFIYILWPYLWMDPINNFIFAFKRMISDHNSLYLLNFYFGDTIPSTNTPWHYRIVWFLITTPVYVLIFFTIGFFILLYKIIRGLFNLDNEDSNLWRNKNELYDFYLFIFFILMFILTMKFNSSQFGSWRHLYFLYPVVIIFLFIAIDFIKSIINYKKISFIIFSLVFMNILFLSYWNFKNHPHQNVYFNSVIKNYAKNNFDLDYWGLSNIHSIKYILNNTDLEFIKVGTVSFSPLHVSKLLLTEKEKKRLIIVNELVEADYLIDSYMKRLRNNFIINEDKYSKYFEITVNDKPINTVYKKN